jgi:hypothetical protein
MRYREQFSLLNKILPFAADDFGMDAASFQIIFINRLLSTGDLAVDISNDFNSAFSGTNSKFDYADANSLLLKSRLVQDLNFALKPYGLEVDTVFSEKLVFASKQDLIIASKIESKISDIPERILDCMMWIHLKRKRVFES